jgi:ATP phosphoribosyltransferase regulatory subunit
LEALGVADYINLNLSIIRGFDYYTGMVFEGYTRDLGFTICGGGRYDNLLEQFGTNGPATGFAVGIDRLLLSLDNQKVQLPIQEDKFFIFYEEEKKEEAINLAKELRSAGEQVVLEIEKRAIEESINYAVENNLKRIIYLGSADELGNRNYEIDELQGKKVIRIK